MLIAAPGSLEPPWGVPPIKPGSAVNVEVAEQAFFRSHGRDDFRNADTQIDYATERQFEGASTCNHFSFVEHGAFHRVQRDLRFAGKTRGYTPYRTFGRECQGRRPQHGRQKFPVLPLPADRAFPLAAIRSDLDDHQSSLNCERPWRPPWRRARAPSRSIVTLPSGVGGGPANQGHALSGKDLVEKPGLAVDVDCAHPGLTNRARVDLSAAVTRIDKGAQSDLRERAGPMSRYVPVQMRHCPQWKGCTPRSGCRSPCERASAIAPNARRSRA